MSTRVRPYSHPPPTCPVCRKPVESRDKSSCCRACGNWMHRDCSIDRWCTECLIAEPFTRAKVLVLAKHFEKQLGSDHPAAVVFAASLMVGGKRDPVRELVDNWPPGIEVAMDNFEKNGIWTRDGRVAIDQIDEDDNGQQASVVFSLIMLCGSGKVVRINHPEFDGEGHCTRCGLHKDNGYEECSSGFWTS